MQVLWVRAGFWRKDSYEQLAANIHSSRGMGAPVQKKRFGWAPTHPWLLLSLVRMSFKANFFFPSCVKAFLGHLAWAGYSLPRSPLAIPLVSHCHGLYLSVFPIRQNSLRQEPALAHLLSLVAPEASTFLGTEETWVPWLSDLCCLCPHYCPLLTPQTQVKVID